MKFRSFTGKRVMSKKGMITFKQEEYETECEIEAEALKKAKGVEEVKQGRKSKSE